MDKSIQVFTRESNSMSQWINLYKYSRERLFYVSVDKSIQVFTRKAILWINLYKCSREKAISCIDLYKSSRERVFYG